MCKNSDLNNSPLVSIITPSYNASHYIEETIQSVLNQTYQNWEMIIVDDISTDDTVNIINKYCKIDDRIHLFILDEKGGASLARNKAIRESKGQYIAFLDADDIWKQNKLERQVQFMQENNCAFSYHNYDLIDENSKSLNIRRLAPSSITLKRALIGCSIGCLSAMYDANKVGLVQIKRIDKRNDDALWFKILEKCGKGILLNESLALYRVSSNSLSSGSKVKLLKYHYNLYRTIMEFNPFKSIFYTMTNVFIYFSNKKKREIKIVKDK